MIYKPAKGSMWDPSVFWHDGRYYAIMMHNPDDVRGLSGIDATCGFIAHSEDGVRWEDGWEVVREPSSPHGGKFFKAFIGRIGDRFIMDHGVVQPHGWQDTLRYYESTDLKTWTYIGSNQPDPAWYVPTGRWDHMYVIPKDESNPSRGYYGYPVATTKPGWPRGCGMSETLDGRSWKILPPPKFDWGDMVSKDLEVGGVERIGGKYVMIGGHADYENGNGYLVYTLVADAPDGPFRPDPEAHRLCGNLTKAVDPVGHLWKVTHLAAWARCRDGEKLISNYAIDPSGIWLLPLRKPVFDDGHLRLGWWRENDRLKGGELPLRDNSVTLNASGDHQVKSLGIDFDRRVGLVLEGTVKASPAGEEPSAGFAFSGKDDQWLELRLELGRRNSRHTRIGWWNRDRGFTTADVIGRGCALVAGLDADTLHTFRLLVRHELFEFYINNLLVQTYFLNEHWDGRFGVLAVDAKAEFTNLKACRMTLAQS